MRGLMAETIMVLTRASFRRALALLSMIAFAAAVPQSVDADEAQGPDRPVPDRPVIVVPYSFLTEPPIPRTAEGDVDGYQLLIEISLLTIDNVDPAIEEADLAEIVDALQSGDSDEAVAQFMDQFVDYMGKISSRNPHGNIMELVFLVMKESVNETNEDKTYFAAKLKLLNQIGNALKDYLDSLNDLQRSCGQSELGCSLRLIGDIADSIVDTESELDQLERDVALAVLDLDDVLDEDDEALRFLEENVLLFYDPMLAIVEGDGPVRLVLPDDDDNADEDEDDRD